MPPPSKRKYKVLAIVGMVLLAHSALSMIEFRHYTRGSTEDDASTSTPLDIIFECLAGLALILFSSAAIYGEFKQLLAAPEVAKWTPDALLNREDFYHFNHRAKALSSLHE